MFIHNTDIYKDKLKYDFITIFITSVQINVPH